MTFVSGIIPNLINGVSQQPDTLRNPTQAVEQVNGLSTAATGLRKRPEFNLVTQLDGSTRAPSGEFLSDYSKRNNSTTHYINRDGVERYAVTVLATPTTGGILVTDLVTGVTTAVSGPSPADYLFTDNAARDIRFLTVADSTFILNRSKVVERSARIAAPTYKKAAYAYVVAGNYGKRYEISLGYFNAIGNFWYETANGGNASDSLDISTDNIAAKLKAQFDILKAGVNATPWATLECIQYGSLLVFRATTFSTITIVGTDGFGGNAMTVFAGEVGDFSKLPPSGDPTLPPIKVSGDVSNDFRGYFVKFKGTAGGEGVYQEVPDIFEDRVDGGEYALDLAFTGFEDSTMPHQLVITPSTKTFSQVSWGDRLAGDSISSPDPSFVGKKINGLFFHRSRLGFLSEDAIIMSGADDFFRFYPRRVASVLDNDPIDVRGNSSFVDDFYYAVSFDERLVVFGGRSQITVKGQPLLTPKTVEINVVSNYEVSRLCNPVAAGRRVFFAFNRQGFTGVSEFYVDDNDNVDAQEITGQVPEYIPKDAIRATSAANESCVAYLTEDRKALYIYRYYLSGQEKLMSSWSRWELAGIDAESGWIVGCGFIEGRLYVTTLSNRGFIVGYLDLGIGTSEDEDFRVHLDNKRRVVVTTGYDSVNDRTLITVDSPFPDGGLAVFQGPALRDGVVVEFEWFYDSLLGLDRAYIPGDATGYTLIVGEPFEFYYEFSTLYIRTQTPQGGTVADVRAKLQLRNLQVVYDKSYNFTAQVTPEGRRIYSYNMNGAFLGSPESTTDETNLVSGLFRFPITTKNLNTKIVIRDDSVYPLQLLSATWEGIYQKRSRGA